MHMETVGIIGLKWCKTLTNRSVYYHVVCVMCSGHSAAGAADTAQDEAVGE